MTIDAYDLAIFDFDGTLADSAEWFFAAYDAVAVRFGLRRASRAALVMVYADAE